MESTSLEKYPHHLDEYLALLKQETEDSLIGEKTLILKERLKNLFSSSDISDISKKASEKLVNNFFLTKTFQEIALFYKRKAFNYPFR